MIRAAFAAFLATVLAASALAAELRVVDGDTIRLDAERIRIVGYDSPEVHGRCPAEQLAARAATRALRQLLGDGRRVTVERGYRLAGWCRTCKRGRPIDLDALIARLGADHSYLAGELRLRCADCGGRDVGILVLAPGR